MLRLRPQRHAKTFVCFASALPWDRAKSSLQSENLGTLRHRGAKVNKSMCGSRGSRSMPCRGASRVKTKKSTQLGRLARGSSELQALERFRAGRLRRPCRRPLRGEKHIEIEQSKPAPGCRWTQRDGRQQEHTEAPAAPDFLPSASSQLATILPYLQPGRFKSEGNEKVFAARPGDFEGRQLCAQQLARSGQIGPIQGLKLAQLRHDPCAACRTCRGACRRRRTAEWPCRAWAWPRKHPSRSSNELKRGTAEAYTGMQRYRP